MQPRPSWARRSAAGQRTDATDLGVFGDRVFWARFEYVYSALKNGTNASIVTIHDDEMGEARGFASDGTHLFISAVNRGDTPGGLFRFPLLGGTPVKIASATNVGEVRNVVLDCDTLFVANTIDRTVLKVAR